MSLETVKLLKETGKDFCTWFPDRLKLQIWKLKIQYDISFFCKIHDELYEEQNVTRKVADLILYAMCMRAYPEYAKLWKEVYKAVRYFGWIFWWLHKGRKWLETIRNGII